MPIIKKHQTLIDFTIQHTGSAEALFTVALANGKNITDDIAPGTLLIATDTVDTTVIKFFKNSINDVITRDYTPGNSNLDSGIGFWAVNDDNIVE